MILYITKPKYDHLPEGSYRARFHEAIKPKHKKNLGCDEQIQLTFEVRIEGQKFYPYQKFCVDGEELYLFLRTWLQARYERYVTDSGGFDFELLKGKEADLTIEHYQQHGYAAPFINIAHITPAGDLVEDCCD